MHALEIFPTEIWEMIFLKLDNKERFKLQYLCRTFYEIIERLMTKEKLWRSLFSKNAIFWVNQIVAKRFPTVKQRQWGSFFQSVFKQLFFSYKKWKFFANNNREIIKNSCGITQYLETNEVITCFDVWVNILAIGTSIGSIYFYKINQMTHKPIYHINNKIPVTQIKLWYLGHKKLFVVTTSINGNLKFWNFYLKKEIVTSQRYHGRNLCVGLNRRLFVENSFTITEYTFDSGRIHQGANCQFDLFEHDDPEAEFLGMYSEKDKLEVLMKHGMATIIIIYKISQTNPVFTKIDDDFYPLRAGTTRDSDILILNDYLTCEFHISSISVTILAHAEFLTVRVETTEDPSLWSVHSIPLAKSVTVTSIFVYADLLLIGLNTGNINLYAVQNISNLLNTTEIFKNLRVLEVDTSPIIALNLTEINKKPYIIASTKSKLFAINISI